MASGWRKSLRVLPLHSSTSGSAPAPTTRAARADTKFEFRGVRAGGGQHIGHDAGQFSAEAGVAGAFDGQQLLPGSPQFSRHRGLGERASSAVASGMSDGDGGLVQVAVPGQGVEGNPGGELLGRNPAGLVVERHQVVAVPVHEQRGDGVAGQADVDAAAVQIPGQRRVAGQQEGVLPLGIQDLQDTAPLDGPVRGRGGRRAAAPVRKGRGCGQLRRRRSSGCCLAHELSPCVLINVSMSSVPKIPSAMNTVTLRRNGTPGSAMTGASQASDWPTRGRTTGPLNPPQPRTRARKRRVGESRRRTFPP